MPALRQRLIDGQPVRGSWLCSGSPVVAELMAGYPFDFLCVDVEHAAIDLPQAQALFQAIQAGRSTCEPWVRLAGVDYAQIKRFLDAGALGVIAPLVRRVEEVETLVAAAKYPPEGARGLGFCRANAYGRDVEAVWQNANDAITVVIQIEHIEAVDVIDDLLAVPGVDAAFIGPYDLSASMGLAGQFDHPDVMKAQVKVREACVRHGVAPGLHIVPPDPVALRSRMTEGYRLLAYSLDITLLHDACTRACADWSLATN